MNCSEVGERLGALADGELPRSIRDEIQTHLDGCSACSREAERLTANYAFMRRTMSRLGAGELDAGFLGELRPRTKAETAAAERESRGPGTRGFRGLAIALLLLVAAVVVYFVFLSPDDVGQEAADERRKTPAGERPDRVDRPDQPGRQPTRRTPIRAPDPHRPSRVVNPDRTGPESGDPAARIARALKARSPAALTTLIEQLAAQAKSKEGAEELREKSVSSGLPEVTGSLLIALGSAPAEVGLRPQLLNQLRGASEAAVRSGAAIGLCRGGTHRARVKYLGRYAIPVATPDEEAARALAESISTESDETARGVLIELVAPAAGRDLEVARTLLDHLRRSPEGPDADRLLAGLAAARHDFLAQEVEAWLASGSVPETKIGAVIAMLRGIDGEAGARAAIERLGTATDVGLRIQLVSALEGLKTDAAAAALQAVITNDASVEVRRRAIAVAAGLPRAMAERLLHAAEQDSDEEIRKLAEDLLKSQDKHDGDDPGGEGPGGRR
jgi:hypothetical protein